MHPPRLLPLPSAATATKAMIARGHWQHSEPSALWTARALQKHPQHIMPCAACLGTVTIHNNWLAYAMPALTVARSRLSLPWAVGSSAEPSDFQIHISTWKLKARHWALEVVSNVLQEIFSNTILQHDDITRPGLAELQEPFL